MSAAPVKRLGEVCEIRNGATPDTGDLANWDGPHAWITPAEMGNLESPEVAATRRTLTDKGLATCSASLAPVNSVILSSRAPIGHLVINAVPMATNQGCKTLVPGNQVDYRYLFYFLRANVALLDSLGTGATFRELSAGKLRDVEIPVPPLDEQKRIAAKLDQLLERADCLERTYRSTEIRSSEALDSEVSAAIRDLSESYEEKLIGDVLEVARGGSPRPISEYITDDADGVNWVKIGDASASRKYIYETAEKIKPTGVKRSRKVGPGDFLLSNSMSFGRPYIMQTDGCIHDGWLVLQDKSSRFDQDYLYYLLGSTTMYSEFSRRAQGSTVQNLNSALVGGVSIPVPPRDVQERFASQVRTLEEQVHQLIMNVARRLELLSELRQSVLEAAFRGEL